MWPHHSVKYRSSVSATFERFVAELVTLFSTENCASVLRTKYSTSALHVMFKLPFTGGSLANEACELLNCYKSNCTSGKLELLLRSRTGENALVCGVNLGGKPKEESEADNEEDLAQGLYESVRKGANHKMKGRSHSADSRFDVKRKPNRPISHDLWLNFCPSRKGWLLV